MSKNPYLCTKKKQWGAPDISHRFSSLESQKKKIVEQHRELIHLATVTDIADDSVTVRIKREKTECSGCAINGICGITASQTLTADSRGMELTPGQTVEIEAAPTARRRSVVLLLGLPLCAMAAAATAANLGGLGDSAAALTSLGAVAAVFGIMYLFRKRLGRNAAWKVRKICR